MTTTTKSLGHIEYPELGFKLVPARRVHVTSYWIGNDEYTIYRVDQDELTHVKKNRKMSNEAARTKILAYAQENNLTMGEWIEDEEDDLVHGAADATLYAIMPLAR